MPMEIDIPSGNTSGDVAQVITSKNKAGGNLADALIAIESFTLAVSLIQTAVGEIDTKKEEAKKEIQDLFGTLGLGIGGKEGLAGKGGLGALAGLLGGLNSEGENPLEGMFASTYEKYLNGNGEDIPGLIPTSEKALQDIQQAYEFALHGGGEDDPAAMGILPAKETALLEIEKQKVGVLQHIESAGKKVLSEINEAVDKAISARIGGIVSYVAGIIGSSASGGRGGSSGNYTAR